MNLKRRRFLLVAAAPAVSCSRSATEWRFLSEAEAQTLTAICEQIIPADQDPGAAWAGVVRFIDRQLAGPYKEHRQTYREGIACVERASVARFGRKFTDLRAGQQVELLSGLEKDKDPFFALAITHTMQGYYGDPRHGGNRERVSWRMLGIPFPPIRGRQQPI